MEWDNVYILNVVEGSFPNEFSTGKAEAIEEERRLLYVAMTRARYDLQLIAPLRYYITQQSRTGDKHVYGARSRFMTDELLRLFDMKSWPAGDARARGAARSTGTRIDAGMKLREMWD